MYYQRALFKAVDETFWHYAIEYHASRDNEDLKMTARLVIRQKDEHGTIGKIVTLRQVEEFFAMLAGNVNLHEWAVTMIEIRAKCLQVELKIAHGVGIDFDEKPC